jgi:hypothetical protein
MNINQPDYKKVLQYDLLYFSYFSSYIDMDDGGKNASMIAEEFVKVLDTIINTSNLVSDAKKNNIIHVKDMMTDEINYNKGISNLFKKSEFIFPGLNKNITIENKPNTEYVHIGKYKIFPDYKITNTDCWQNNINDEGNVVNYTLNAVGGKECFELLVYTLLTKYHGKVMDAFTKKNDNKNDGILFSGFCGNPNGHSVAIYYYKIFDSNRKNYNYIIMVFNSGIGLGHHEYRNDKDSCVYIRYVKLKNFNYLFSELTIFHEINFIIQNEEDEQIIIDIFYETIDKYSKNISDEQKQTIFNTPEKDESRFIFPPMGNSCTFYGIYFCIKIILINFDVKFEIFDYFLYKHIYIKWQVGIPPHSDLNYDMMTIINNTIIKKYESYKRIFTEEGNIKNYPDNLHIKIY